MELHQNYESCTISDDMAHISPTQVLAMLDVKPRLLRSRGTFGQRLTLLVGGDHLVGSPSSFWPLSRRSRASSDRTWKSRRRAPLVASSFR